VLLQIVNPDSDPPQAGWVLLIRGQPLNDRLTLFPTPEAALQWAEDRVPHLRPGLFFLSGPYETTLVVEH